MDRHAPPGSTLKGSEASMVKGRAWGFSEVKAHQKKGKKKRECLRKCKLLHYAWDRLRERLVGDLPASLSFRTRVRIVLETRLLGTLWTVFQVLATLVGCAFYVVRTYNMALEEYGKCEVAFGVIVAADLLVRWYADDSRRYFIFKSSSLIDVASLLPLLVDAFIRLCHGTKLHFGFIFLRSVKVIKLLRVLRLFRLKKKLTSAAAQQMLVVALVAASLIFVSASLINITEGLPFGTSVYYTIVTMATVGYGDISVTTSIGRFVVCCVIIASFVWLPMEINKLTQMLSLRSRFLTTFTPEMEKPNVLVVGHLEAGKLRLFLTEFFHPDRRSAIGSGALYQVVVLNPEDPSDELVEVLEDPLLESRVTYVKGTLMNEDDLKRAGAHTALACFILANWITADSEAEDAQTVLRTLMIKTFRPTMPCYVQLHHAHNRVQLHMLKKQRVTCIEEIKMSILGTAAVYPGFTTLLSNLITSSSDQGEDTAKLSGWMREYALGSGKELYSIKLHAAFHGVSFRRAAMDIFTQFEGKVLLMGVEERELKASKDETGRPAYYLRRALLNPGSDYIFNVQPGVQTWAFVLARNRRTAERILTLENSMQQLKLNTDDKSTSGGKKKKKMKRPRRGTEEMLAYYSHDVMDDSRQERRGSHGDDDEDDDDEDDDRGQQKGSDVGQPATAPVLVQQQQPLPAPPLGALAVVTEAVPDQAAPPPTDTPMASAQAPPSAPPSSDVEPESNASRFRVDDSRLQLPPPPPQPTEDAGVLPLSQSVVVAATAEMVYKDVSLVLVDDVSDLDFVKDHVVVMGAGLGSHLDFFLAPLRAAYLSGTGYSKHVVVFSETGLRDFMQDYGATTSSSSTGSITTGGATPTGSHTTPSSQSRQRASSGGQSGSSASTPPRYTIYVVEGSPHKASDLRRAGLERASAVVVLADKAAVQDIDEEVVDQSVIHQFLTIEKFRCRTPAYPSAAPSIADVAAFMLQQRRASPLNYVVEVLSVATLKILDQTYKTCKGKSRARDGHRKSVFRRSMHYLASNANRVSSSLHHHHHHHHHKRHTDGSGAGLGPSTLATPPLSKQNSVDRLYAPSSPLAAARHATPTHHAAQRKPSEAPSAANGPSSASHERSSMEFGIHSSNCYPFVTSGSSFLIDVFDVMSCQLFFNSDMLRFVDLLLALDTHDHRQHLLLPTSPPHASHTSNPFGSGGDAASSSSASPRGAVGSGRLGAVSIPLHAAGQEFSYLFELFMHDYDALPIALYRHDEADDVCYVYTGPSPATALRASDIVFFLAPAKSMARIFSDNPPRARGQQGAGGK